MKLFFLSGILSVLSFCASGQSKVAPATSSPICIGETVTVPSAILGEKRSLNIYLPPEYKQNDTTRFPVVYLLDGGMDEDFLHITGLYQFNSFPWINRVQPSIIVGIVNTNRLRDMSFPTRDTAERRHYPQAGHSDNFIRFIGEEVQPYIQQHYKTSESKTLIGESMGGLLATEILLHKPSLFTNYIIVSPSLGWDNGSLLDQPLTHLTANDHGHITVYVGVGKEGLTNNNPPRVMEVDANMLADKLKQAKSKQLTVYFDYLPQEDHATIMHQAVFNALHFFNPSAH